MVKLMVWNKLPLDGLATDNSPSNTTLSFARYGDAVIIFKFLFHVNQIVQVLSALPPPNCASSKCDCPPLPTAVTVSTTATAAGPVPRMMIISLIKIQSNFVKSIN